MLFHLDRLRVFAFREFRTHWRRSVASIGVIAVSAALLVATLGIFGSLTGSVERLGTGLSGTAAFEVAGVADGGFDQAVRADVAAVPGVAAAVPLVRTAMNSERGKVMLLGVDPSSTQLSSDLSAAITAQLAATAGLPPLRNGVAVGAATGAVRGDILTLGTDTVTVATVLDGEAARQLNGGHFVLAPLALAQRLAVHERQLDSVFVVTDRSADTGAVRSAVTAAVAGRAIVADANFRTAQADNAVSTFRYAMLISSSIALVVAGFLIFNAMTMAVVQRRPTFALLRAIGGRGPVIAADLLVEAAFVGLIGAAIGIPIGWLLGRWAITRLPSLMIQSIDARLMYLPSPYAIPVAVLACVTASVAASALAARQVYRVAPIEALAPVGAGAADHGSRTTRVIAGIAATAGVAAAFLVAFLVPGRSAMGAIAVFLVAGIGLAFAFAKPIVAATAFVARRLRAPGQLAAESIVRAERRVWAAILAVAIAVAMVTTIVGGNKNAIDSATDSLSSVARTDLYVSTNSVDESPTGPLLPTEVIEKVAAVPGVAQAVPGQWLYATVGELRVTIQGIIGGSHSIMSAAMSDDVRQRVLAGEGIAVSRDVATALHLSPGDDFPLTTSRGVRTVRVLEVVPYFSVLGGAVALNLVQLQEWFDRPGANHLELTAAPGTDIDRLAAAIRDIAPGSVDIYTGREALSAVADALRQGVSLVEALTWIVSAVAAVALLNTLLLSVLDRRRELGVLRALGSSRRFTLRVVLAEAAATGAVGGILGLALGSVAHFLNSRVWGQATTIDVVYEPDPRAFLFGGIALLLTLAGAIPPALRAARLNIVQAVAVD
ncbi:ABC transporter permease [Nocardia wallacei]|uniref:ABC transporter permease n=1 Tax=Nocardia wallacei TaxID=480035 RepID=UPI0024538FF2|nr:FtsX-like permease family protein [Nocardia wallacei]